ncbi:MULTISPECIES: helix-turn-helix transcriptional regulator [Aneurinibacillus]|uniref:Helix-turn-helix transcriptional regulator n=1 Tax=Aneurinibacillus thermoaerophilus TaxID=143495 RepID=A0A1G8BGE5_ANETH|nr:MULTISPECIES: helix-turn-helix transcriptional regulator [Aneurinibacillus]AMA71438.1 DNA-binding protein [Aneurinibacillus sp. XH2]MED0674260.1 helix-turn-helix transcriptional regulator [Aneurinibacillus thermoaerophilus]MED0678644.1 helix-turn-helix transcriptional regulator [Aneurinibacillus thermoaerophilus]MED0737810.1 helix-turn-helix transcriptional regulator [Aneurinibacillus thermoaerophilus]MED0755842.1 helix-turn-helix transcriptional regulator [Aneurinibacillus thermoaerophilus
MLWNRIAVCRAEKGWTQQELAKRVGVSRQTIASIEKNKYNPSLILAFKIALSFEKSLTEIFGYQEENEL